SVRTLSVAGDDAVDAEPSRADVDEVELRLPHLTPGHRVAGVTPRAVAHVRKEVSDVVELESRAAGSSEAAAGEAHRRARPVAVVVRPAAGLISSLPIGYVTAPASFGRSRRSQGERCSSSGCDHDSYPIQLHPHAIPSL